MESEQLKAARVFVTNPTCLALAAGVYPGLLATFPTETKFRKMPLSQHFQIQRKLTWATQPASREEAAAVQTTFSALRQPMANMKNPLTG